MYLTHEASSDDGGLDFRHALAIESFLFNCSLSK
jgi:hypothetical protein